MRTLDSPSLLRGAASSPARVRTILEYVGMRSEPTAASPGPIDPELPTAQGLSSTGDRWGMMVLLRSLVAIAWLSATGSAAPVLLGVGTVPGTARDLSGLSGNYTFPPPDSSTPRQDRLGSFGSGIAYSGTGSQYYLVNDSGYSNATPGYQTRMQVFDIKVDPASMSVTPTLLQTRLLTNESGQNFVGSSTAFTSANASTNLRLDPEAIRVGRDGTVYISDEYGPSIYQFNAQGQRLQALNVPTEFQVAHPAGDATTEQSLNSSGRQSNKGFEGLAITPDGHTLFAAIQQPLIQDLAAPGLSNNLNVYDRILKLNLDTGKTSEYVYKLSDNSRSVSELLAVNDHQFLVDERDSNAGTAASYKRLLLIDTANATDVSGFPSLLNLSDGTLLAGITTTTRSQFLDLINGGYGLNNANFPQNIEGMTWGPDLPDGRHLLLITSDNNLSSSEPTYIYAFAVSNADLPGYQAQQFNGAVVPEPRSFTILCLGLLGVGWSAWQGRRNA